MRTLFITILLLPFLAMGQAKNSKKHPNRKHMTVGYDSLRLELYKELNFARTDPQEYDVIFQKWLKPKKEALKLLKIESPELFKDPHTTDAEHLDSLGTSTYKPKPPLAIDEKLEKLAQLKAEDMALNKYFAHKDKHGKFSDYYLIKSGVECEHLDWGFCTSESCHTAIISADYADITEINTAIKYLLTSPGHRDHILSRNDRIDNAMGIGISKIILKRKAHYYVAVLVIKKER